LKAIQADPALRLQVIASGMHLAAEFGRTWREIEAEEAWRLDVLKQRIADSC